MLCCTFIWWLVTRYSLVGRTARLGWTACWYIVKRLPKEIVDCLPPYGGQVSVGFVVLTTCPLLFSQNEHSESFKQSLGHVQVVSLTVGNLSMSCRCVFTQENRFAGENAMRRLLPLVGHP